MDVLVDRPVTCKDCKQDFIFSAKEQLFYMRMDEKMKNESPSQRFPPPKRCGDCRKMRKPYKKKFTEIIEKKRTRKGDRKLGFTTINSAVVLESVCLELVEAGDADGRNV